MNKIMTMIAAISVLGYVAHAAPRVVFVDSYHEGYAWSDGITEGIKATLGDGVELTVIRLDTNRNPDEEFKKGAAQKAKDSIDAIQPQVVIAADDNASKYLIVPFFKGTAMPVVFCGVNWDASVYGFPCENVTGMIEVTPVDGLIQLMKQMRSGSRVGFIGPDIITCHKEFDNITKEFGIDVTPYFAKDVEDYKKGFLELQEKVDFIILDSDGGLYNDMAADLQTFFAENTHKPTGSCYDFMSKYTLISYAKQPAEQGKWASEAALEIIGGKSPKDIPTAKNKQGKLILNAKLAEQAGIEIPYSIVEIAEQVIE